MSLSEAQEQSSVVKWSQMVRGKYPELMLLFHIPNERYCSAVQGANLKRQGVKRGVPDLFLPVARGRYHGLFIEMKTLKGRTSEDQEWWGSHLLSQNYFWEVCHGWQSAVKVIEWYMRLRGDQP